MDSPFLIEPSLSYLPLLSQVHENTQHRQTLSPINLRTPTPISRKELESLNTKIKQQIASNRKRYEKLLTLNPYFSMKLYAPSNTLLAQDWHTGTLGRMMRQVDLLLQQGNLLQKQIKKVQLKRMQADHQDPSLRDELKSHFAFLRRVWMDCDKEQSRGALDRMEELNKRVVIIKNSIMSVADHQKKIHMHIHNNQYEAAERRAREAVRQSEEYRKLRENWERMGMALQEKQGQMERIMQKYEQTLKQRDTQVARLQQEVEELRKGGKEWKEKVFLCEKKQTKLVQKIAELETEIKARNKNASHLKENSETNNNSNLKFLKDEGYINQIKFRKLDFDAHIRRSNINVDNNKQVYSDKAIIDQISQSKEKISKTAHSLPQISPLPLLSSPTSLSKDTHLITPHKVHQENLSADIEPQRQQSDNQSSRHIRQNRSIQARKGRFTRMRSPANGKLIKPSQNDQTKRAIQCLSPRLRELKQQHHSVAARTCHLQ